MTHVPGIDWRVDAVVRVTDGDTVRLHLSREERLSNDLTATYSTSPANGVPVRLIILDTPERGQDGYDRARADLGSWLGHRAGRLRVTTYESAGFDRLLGDIYVDGDRGDTATQHMLRVGWEPYVRGAASVG